MPVLPERLCALASLDQAKPVQVLSQENGTPYPSMQKAVNSLELLGLVKTWRDGKQRFVEPTSPSISALARALIFDAPREDWHLVLRGTRPQLLHVLDRVKDPDLTVEVLGLSRSTVYRAIQQHAPRGLLVRDPAGYRINPRLSEFKAFLLEWNSLRATHVLRQLDPAASPVWRLGPEILFRSRRTLKGPKIHLGGYSAMEATGAPIIQRGDSTTYYLSSRRLTSADALLQAMVTESNDLAPMSAQPTPSTRAQWTAFTEANPMPGLERKALIYNKRDEVLAIQSYLRAHVAPGFLPWGEYQRFRQQFGVEGVP